MKKPLITISLPIVSVIVALLFIEIFLRILGMCFPLSDEKCYGPSPIPELPHLARANFKTRHFSINSSHLRDSEIPLQKPSGTFRIAIVGNSVTIGHQIPQSDLFTELIENEFENISNNYPKVEIINAAQAGYNINHFLPFTQHFVYPHQPDIILYQFCWNDIDVPTKRTRQRFANPNQEKDLFRYFRMHSLIYRNMYKLIKVDTFVTGLLDFYRNPEMLNNFYHDLFFWAEDVRSHDMQFIVTILPTSLEVQAPEKYPDINLEFISVKNDIIKKLEEEEVQVFDLSGALREHYVNHKKSLFKGLVHLNKRGHRQAAQILTKHLIHYLPSSDPETVK